MSVLILGIASYPTLSPSFQNSPNFDSINFTLTEIAFAQEDEEENEDDEQEEAEEELEEEFEELEEEEEIEIEAEVEDGIAKVKVEIGNEEFEFEFELVSTDPEDIREEIVSQILAQTDLTIDQIGEFEIEFEEELEAEEEEELEEEEEIEIEVEIKKGKTKIKIELEDEKSRFVLDTIDESEIISAIEEETGLDESQIRSIWDFEIEDEEEDEFDEEEREKDLSKLSEHEEEAKENAEQIILELQQKIEELEQRLQTLLEKFETGEYFGPVPEPDPVPTSYSISFAGTATSLDDDSVVTDVDGEIFLETLMTGTYSSKLRITGGEILVGETFYDFVIGKARISSTGPSGEKDSMIILGQVMDDEGNVNTIKILLHAESPLAGDFGLEPVEFEITKSKIAGQWNLSAYGQLSLLEV